MSWTIALVLSLALVLQESQPTTAPATQPNILSGPTVIERPAQPTIVKRAFDGALEDVGAEPEVAAVAALNLTLEQRTICGESLTARHAAFDRIVRGNYGLIVELGTLQGEDDPQKRIDLLNRARFAFEPFFKRGMFIDEIQDHLTMEQREQFNQMFHEYREARLADLQRTHGIGRQQAAFRARLEALGHMIRESIERQVGLERDEFERIADDLQLTQEQKAKAEAIFGPIAVKRLQGITTTAAERAEAFRKFNGVLTSKQRQKLMALLIERWTSESSAPPATQPQP